MNDYFSLFGLAPCYEVDVTALAETWRQMQRIYHPDRYAGKSDREVRLAVQRAAMVNEAYEVLKSPVKRAWYLLELRGLDGKADSHITRDTGFLVAQLELRERLGEAESDADPFASLDALAGEARAQFALLEAEFSRTCEGGDFEAAAEVAAKMQFFSKFLDEIDTVEERLDS